MSSGRVGILARILVCCAIISAFGPPEAGAQWPEGGANLPGLVSTETLIIGAVVTAAVLTVLVIAARKASDQGKGEDSAPADTTDAGSRINAKGLSSPALAMLTGVSAGRGSGPSAAKHTVIAAVVFRREGADYLGLRVTYR